MIAPETVALILLAAGRSRRFGDENKLAHPLGALALGLHSAKMLSLFPFATKIAVVAPGAPDFASLGFEEVENPDPGAGQSRSIKIGLDRAYGALPAAVLIALADMPFVGPSHIESMLARFDERTPVPASSSGGNRQPPVLFSSILFAELSHLAGDSGARAMLRDASAVVGSAAELADIDTREDLERLTLLGSATLSQTGD